MKEWLSKLNKLSARQKQYIIWVIVAILGLVLVIWWVFSTAEKLRTIDWSSTEDTISFPEKEESSIEDFLPEWSLEETFLLDFEEESLDE